MSGIDCEMLVEAASSEREECATDAGQVAERSRAAMPYNAVYDIEWKVPSLSLTAMPTLLS